MGRVVTPEDAWASAKELGEVTGFRDRFCGIKGRLGRALARCAGRDEERARLSDGMDEHLEQRGKIGLVLFQVRRLKEQKIAIPDAELIQPRP